MSKPVLPYLYYQVLTRGYPVFALSNYKMVRIIWVRWNATQRKHENRSNRHAIYNSAFSQLESDKDLYFNVMSGNIGK